MLPQTFSPTGTYTLRQLDRARGYRLLVHAEIEAFVEDIAKDALLAQITSWKVHRKPSQLIVSFIASYHTGFAGTDSDSAALPIATRPADKNTVDEIIQVATTQYMKRHGENHGIREENLRRLLIPIGVDFAELDATWLTNISEFGKKRGEVAHKTIGAQQAIDPLTEFNDVKNLLVGLRKLDEVVGNLT